MSALSNPIFFILNPALFSLILVRMGCTSFGKPSSPVFQPTGSLALTSPPAVIPAGRGAPLPLFLIASAGEVPIAVSAPGTRARSSRTAIICGRAGPVVLSAVSPSSPSPPGGRATGLDLMTKVVVFTPKPRRGPVALKLKVQRHFKRLPAF